MTGEKINSYSPENTSRNDDASEGDFEYPPFNLEKAKEQVAQVHILRSAKEMPKNPDAENQTIAKDRSRARI